MFSSLLQVTNVFSERVTYSGLITGTCAGQQNVKLQIRKGMSG